MSSAAFPIAGVLLSGLGERIRTFSKRRKVSRNFHEYDGNKLVSYLCAKFIFMTQTGCYMVSEQVYSKLRLATTCSFQT